MDRNTSLIWILGAAALGAAAMYMLDPVQGKRRRALVRDKAISARIRTRKTIDATSHDLANRVHGLKAKARHLLPEQAGASTPDSGP